MNCIVAVDENWAIGKDNKLLVSIPMDMKFFREMTMNKVVVMGRKTLESLPGGQPLHGRTNVVLTKNENYTKKGCEVFHSVEETLEFLKQFSSENVYIIGTMNDIDRSVESMDFALRRRFSWIEVTAEESDIIIKNNLYAVRTCI